MSESVSSSAVLMMVLSLSNVKPIRLKKLDAHSGEKNKKMSHLIDCERKVRHKVCLKTKFGIPG